MKIRYKRLAPALETCRNAGSLYETLYMDIALPGFRRYFRTGLRCAAGPM